MAPIDGAGGLMVILPDIPRMISQRRPMMEGWFQGCQPRSGVRCGERP